MILMIFVNDLWTLTDIPAWLGHVKRGVDGMGLADYVFPAFLFIVGLSLPFAINSRRSKGDTDWQLIQHVLVRSVALLVMGVFLVNGETINAQATGLPGYLWYPLCCFCFILIWNNYSETTNAKLVIGLKAAAIVTLLILAYVYRGGEAGNIQRFAPQWWGILGLIGWAYLASGLVTIFARNNLIVVFGGWVFFAALSILYKAGLVPAFLSFIPEAILGGTLTGLTMGGVLAATVFQSLRAKEDNKKLTLTLGAMSLVWILLSLVTRPYWGLSKLGATPAWLFYCSACTLVAFLIIYWIADVWKITGWFSVIRPAGTGTLLCYLIPYFIYLHLPGVVSRGGLGLLKSLLYALLCAVITGALMRWGVRLKL